jgi:hypothetical protein
MNRLFFANAGTARDLGALFAQTFNQLVERCFGRSGDFDLRTTWVDPLLANFKIYDVKSCSLGDNLIEHLRQSQRVDDVSA